MTEKLTTEQVEAELKTLDERLCVMNECVDIKGLFVCITIETGDLCYFWKMNLGHEAEQIWFDDGKICELSDKILSVMDRWDGVI